MTLLTALNRAQRRLSLAVTSTIIADGQETQNLLWELANVEAEEVISRAEYDFPALKRTKSFTMTTGATLQASGKPSDMKRPISDTFWNRSTDRKIIGPIDDVDWAIANGVPITTGITQYAMLRYDGLHIWPAPTAADTAAYDYVLNTPILAVDGTTYRTSFAADTDTYLLGDRLLVLGVVWRYKADKGRDYAEDLKSYEIALQQEASAGKGSRALTIAPPDVDELGMGLIPDTGFTGAP